MDINLMTTLLIGGGLCTCGFVFNLYRTGKKQEIYAIVKSLVNEAEVRFGSGTGKLKYDFVVGRIYSVIPGYFKIFISEELLDLWIETAVKELQEYLEDKTGK